MDLQTAARITGKSAEAPDSAASYKAGIQFLSEKRFKADTLGAVWGYTR